MTSVRSMQKKKKNRVRQYSDAERSTIVLFKLEVSGPLLSLMHVARYEACGIRANIFLRTFSMNHFTSVDTNQVRLRLSLFYTRSDTIS